MTCSEIIESMSKWAIPEGLGLIKGKHRALGILQVNLYAVVKHNDTKSEVTAMISKHLRTNLVDLNLELNGYLTIINLDNDRNIRKIGRAKLKYVIRK